VGAYGEVHTGEYGYLGAVGGYGVYGWDPEGNYGVLGGSDRGVYGYAATSADHAARFQGDVYVSGSINKAACSFLIDHPLDPENRLLRHNCVESPEHLLVYRGRVSVGASGEAQVQMPDYFGAVSNEEEASIHLTPVGRPFDIGAEWNPGFGSFTVYGEPGREVFWQVLVERDDPVIRELARPVEEEKGPGNKYCGRGELLHPTAYGYPESMRPRSEEEEMMARYEQERALRRESTERRVPLLERPFGREETERPTMREAPTTPER
jgi:hypothetical protein